jgi:hypothetical protein
LGTLRGDGSERSGSKRRCLLQSLRIAEYLTGIELPELTHRVKHGRQRFTHTYLWICDVPLRDGADAMTIKWLTIEIRNAADEVTYRNSFITDLPVERDTIVELAACGRARCKIENESFNTLKTKGYNLEHNFGHGNKHLSAVLATLNRVRFKVMRLCCRFENRGRLGIWRRRN